MRWSRVRLDWVAHEVRNTIDPLKLGGTAFLYSIPLLDELGDGAIEDTALIGSNKLLLQGGEVLISKLNPRITRVFQAREQSVPTLASTEFIALKPTNAVNRGFLEYWLQNELLRQYLDSVSTSVTRSQQRVRPDSLTKTWLDLPVLREQRAIADYLDRETARVDALIEKKQRMIELLEEERMAITIDGVSGRFTSNALSASTLPWLECCGAGWHEVKLSLVAQLGSGHTPSRSHPEWWQECNIPWITTGEVAQLRSDRTEYLVKTREKISELGIANSAARIHPSGTVVLSRTASPGFSAIMSQNMATSQDFATWTCGPLIRPRFLLLCLRAMRQDLLGRLAMGSTHKTIYMPDINSLRVPLPDVQEQDAIVTSVWKKLNVTDSLVERVYRQVVQLREHRQALITAAVTGQIDVPGVPE